MSRQAAATEPISLISYLSDQKENIVRKKSVKILLSNFPSSSDLGAICDSLGLFISQSNPPVRLERILLADNALASLPQSFALLCTPHLRSLDLHNNNLVQIPSNLASFCPQLEILDVSQNCIAHVSSSSLLKFENLRRLILDDNRICFLPPILGEMINLEQILVHRNPLIMPTNDLINSMTDGINELKAYLVANSTTLDLQIESHLSGFQRPNLPKTPSLARTRSLSDTKSRSLKASRRMGLIINNSRTTPDSGAYHSGTDSNTPSKPERKLLLPTNEKSDFQDFVRQSESHGLLDKPLVPSTYTASTAVDPRPYSPTAPLQAGQSGRQSSQSRSRSNTVQDSDHALDQSELVEGDQKPGAYLRRLSTLQERPSDEIVKITKMEASSEAEKLDANLKQYQRNFANEKSPSRQPVKKTSSLTLGSAQYLTQNASTLQHGVASPGNQQPFEKSTVVKVSRKILFSFSELHLAIKRFTGFCTDKRVSARLANLLNSSKENIDGLVEVMEALEEEEENQESVMSAIHACIDSFKAILSSLNDNFTSFVAKIDVCFIRIIYLTLFGSLNELYNAHRLLIQNNSLKPHSAFTKNLSITSLTNMDFRSRASLGSGEDSQADNAQLNLEETGLTVEEIDERLYQSIGLATSSAQTVFGELTKAISKSAVASANAKNSQAVSPSVAAKFKDLANVCMSSMEVTKRLDMKLGSIRSNQTLISRKSFWDDINQFLKSVIQTFSSVKDIMRDAPILNEVRQSMAHLTKTTKDLTIALEASSYKTMPDVTGSPHLPASSTSHLGASLGSTPPILNLATVNASHPSSLTAPVRTPLVATVGSAAAQAILLQQDSHSGQTNSQLSFNIPPQIASDVLNTGLHTAPVQSMDHYYAKNVNPFDKL